MCVCVCVCVCVCFVCDALVFIEFFIAALCEYRYDYLFNAVFCVNLLLHITCKPLPVCAV